jgi:hypothetical protein
MNAEVSSNKSGMTTFEMKNLENKTSNGKQAISATDWRYTSPKT